MINNIDKHRLLVTVGSAYQSFNVAAQMRPLIQRQALATGLPLPPKINVYLKPEDNLCPLAVGDELFIDDIDAEENKEIDFRFDISLEEPGIVKGHLIDTLEQFCSVCSKTVLLFKPCLS